MEEGNGINNEKGARTSERLATGSLSAGPWHLGRRSQKRSPIIHCNPLPHCGLLFSAGIPECLQVRNDSQHTCVRHNDESGARRAGSARRRTRGRPGPAATTSARRARPDRALGEPARRHQGAEVEDLPPCRVLREGRLAREPHVRGLRPKGTPDGLRMPVLLRAPLRSLCRRVQREAPARRRRVRADRASSRAQLPSRLGNRLPRYRNSSLVSWRQYERQACLGRSLAGAFAREGLRTLPRSMESIMTSMYTKTPDRMEDTIKGREKGLVDRASRYFWSERLRPIFTFATMYMGMSPFDAPSTYSLLPYTELAEGIWCPGPPPRPARISDPGTSKTHVPSPQEYTRVVSALAAVV
ncbi:hypothetical protein GGR56DRAFT_654440 [Xylariaceae sp. FL0804]|nr:hypothetical protein GGR56DRAFT_654440 [Xylariaceae sp. FL0804]